jgi:hypothetical protein
MNLHGAARALLCAWPAWLAGCHIPEANVYNLHEVRDPDGSARRVGAPMNRVEYLARNIVLAVMTNDAQVKKKDDEKIDDPDAIALENLIQLADCDVEDPWVRGLQVDMMSWLAVDDDYKLARERAVIELGRLALDLGVKVPTQLAPEAVPAKPDDIVGPLGDLVSGVRAFVETQQAPGADFKAACEELQALVLDRDGARRIAAATNALLARTGHDAPAMADLRALHEQAAQRAVALALGEALRDKDPVVRAAAVEAALRASGDELAPLRLQALEDPSDIVVIAVLRGVADRGLHTPQDLPPEQAEALRKTFIDHFVTLARDLRSPVSAAACAALNKSADSGFATYRWEEWNRWWDLSGGASASQASDQAGP